MSETEERLRTWPLDQSAQERLCLGILSLDVRFAEVKPRRPKGGPDGARDIEAVFENQKVWGAVGFRKNARDDNKDKRWVKKKFRDDVDAAKKEDPSLWGFVFFTNIDLTPKEQEGLKQYAHLKQLAFVELYWRERLRVELDAPRGLGFRFTYLDISLSRAEQQAFFAEYGQALERLVQEGFRAMDKRLHRAEFLQEYQRHLVWADLIVNLNRVLNAEELGHYRFLAQIKDSSGGHRHRSLWIGGQDAFHSATRSEDGSPVLLLGTMRLAWCRELLDKTVTGPGDLGAIERALNASPFNGLETLTNYPEQFQGVSTKQLKVGVGLAGRVPFSTLSDLERKFVSMWVTKPLVPLIESMYLIVNDYVLAGGRREQLHLKEESTPPPWIKTLTDKEANTPWVCVLRQDMLGAPTLVLGEDFSQWDFSYTHWHIDFSQSTPPKKQDQ
jgi:hypothetical protein